MQPNNQNKFELFLSRYVEGGRKGVARTTFADECTFGGNKTQIIQKPLFLDWQVELKIQVNSLSMITFKWHLNFQNMSNVFTLIK